MWNLWTLQQDTKTPASELFSIRQWVRDTTGFDGWWEARQFDYAVSYFGRWVEARLHELDDRHQPKYTLAGLLGDDSKSQTTPEGIRALAATFGSLPGAT